MITVKNSFKKTEVQMYEIRNHTTWADISYHGSTLNINSDYGNWSYKWGQQKDFPKFLASLDMYYLAGKLGEDKEFKAEETLRSMSDQLDTLVADEVIPEEKKAEIYEELERICGAASLSDAQSNVYNSSIVNHFIDKDFDLVTGVSRLFERFFHEIWLDFMKELKREREKPTVENVIKPNGSWLGLFIKMKEYGHKVVQVPVISFDENQSYEITLSAILNDSVGISRLKRTLLFKNEKRSEGENELIKLINNNGIKHLAQTHEAFISDTSNLPSLNASFESDPVLIFVNKGIHIVKLKKEDSVYHWVSVYDKKKSFRLKDSKWMYISDLKTS